MKTARPTPILLTLLAAAALPACSSQMLYGGGQAWQRTECNRMPDAEQRKRCMDSSALSFDEYQRQAAAAKGAVC